jgi:hypothetical protein
MTGSVFPVKCYLALTAKWCIIMMYYICRTSSRSSQTFTSDVLLMIVILFE